MPKRAVRDPSARSRLALPDLVVQSDVFDDVTRLNIGGELDAWTCGALMDVVERATALNGRRITIDLGGLTFLDSVGVRTFMMFATSSATVSRWAASARRRTASSS